MLKAGDLVYRVIEVDPPGEELHTWKVASTVVERASDRQILLKTYFAGMSIKRFQPDAYGRFFFKTPLQAIRHFLISQKSEVEALDRRWREAERAIEWAQAQEGVRP